MKLIFALGNPGAEYTKTRHNLGFLVLDALAEQWGASFQTKPKFKAEVAEAEVDGEKVILAKPAMFYNLAGESAQAICNFYKLQNTDILVIHDDLALPIGTIRTRLGGSSAGNNGIKSISQHLGEEYARLRIGIWSEHREGIDAKDFVLGQLRLTTEQRTALTQQVSAVVEAFAKGELNASTHRF